MAVISLNNASADPLIDDTHRQALQAAVDQVNRVVLGKIAQVRVAFACFLADGHLLIEDLPGVGKTTLAHALAATFALTFQRIQFTSDLLPSDIIGVSVYERSAADSGLGAFRFHPGPLFAQLVLADEINRATPKTQSALLEAMAEHQVTVDGVTHPLPEPFFVVATQNPLDLAGTFALPDSQLDRFMLRVSLDYPDRDAERALLMATDRRELIAHLEPRLGYAQILTLRAAVSRVIASSALIDYVQLLLEASRTHAEIAVGLSPRAGLAMLHAARAWALLDERAFCLPEDVQAIFVACAAHRLIPAAAGRATGVDLATQLLAQVPVR